MEATLPVELSATGTTDPLDANGIYLKIGDHVVGDIHNGKVIRASPL